LRRFQKLTTIRGECLVELQCQVAELFFEDGMLVSNPERVGKLDHVAARGQEHLKDGVIDLLRRFDQNFSGGNAATNGLQFFFWNVQNIRKTHQLRGAIELSTPSLDL